MDLPSEVGSEMGERSTEQSTQTPTVEPNHQNKIDLYKTYDVMTGVRIAATLGGFFSLMVLLVVYKSKCKSRSLSDENLEAAVAAAAAGVGREELLGKAFSVCVPPNPNHPHPHPHPHPRYPPPPTSHHQHASPYLRKANADKPPPYPEDDEIHELDQFRLCGQNLLQVPSSRRSSRRPSSITCSSSDTSYLERRGSALEMGLPIPPPFANKQNKLIEESWDFYYPIDIQVVQPTPDISPCESQISVLEGRVGLGAGKLAPLASVSSWGLPTRTEEETHSIGSDSVFLDEELADTEDEVEGFSTDSDPDCVLPSRTAPLSTADAQTRRLDDNRVPLRRYSSPSRGGEDSSRSCDESEEAPLPRRKPPVKSSSESETVCEPPERDGKKLGESAGFISQPNMSVSCDHLAKALREHSTHRSASSKSIVEYCTWSQETLF